MTIFEICNDYIKGLSENVRSKRCSGFCAVELRYSFSVTRSFCNNTYSDTHKAFIVMHLLPSLQYSTP